MFPEQITAGLRPWQPLKLYMGGVRENEDWTIRADAGVYNPVLGETYQAIALQGLSFQRSQNSGQVFPQPGPAVQYYRRLQSIVEAPARETSFFDGIDVTIPGMYRALRQTAPAEAQAALEAIDREVQSAVQSFRLVDPSASAPALARALAATRVALTRPGTDPDVAFQLRVKEEQLQRAIRATLGVSFTALAQPGGLQDQAGRGGPPRPATIGPVVPGQTFDVRTTFVNQSGIAVKDVQLKIEGLGNRAAPPAAPSEAVANTPVVSRFSVTVPQDAAFTRPYFTRSSIQDSRYQVKDQSQLHRPAGEPALVAAASFSVEGVPVEIREPVTRLESKAPYGYEARVLALVPAIAVTLSPSRAIVPTAVTTKTVRLRADILNNVEGRSEGTVRLNVPAGWKSEPASQPFQFARAGERASYAFTVSIPTLESRTYRIEAVAASDGREFREGYDAVQHRDLETRYLYRDAAASIRGIDVTMPAGLRVGYVMGIGDDVPAGLAQLGAEVHLLSAGDLAGADLSRFDAIVTGTRAYAVRDDLKTYNRRLLDYVNAGGNLIVLYNTQELVPAQYAPFPAQLPRNAEEVSEEDSPVEILTPSHPVLNAPNKITKTDFDDWVEQRGSKFWSEWDAAYTPVIATWDQGQSPQKGGWLHAKYGAGHYTYFAYALHRQLPYGVPGAYRLLANLLSQSSGTKRP
jgi:hypothetical protein